MKATVTYGRTVSANYQSQKCELTIEIDVPDDANQGQQQLRHLEALGDIKTTVNKFLGIKEN